MLPRLLPDEHLPPAYRAFLDTLKRSGFRGDIHTDYATRLVTATDNSVYQLLPLGVIYPRDQTDVARTLRLLGRPEHTEIKLSPRGGGTGTNGQALCDGLIVDVSRYMRAIVDVNLEEGWAIVEPGVVLDQLNARLAPHGVFFAPNLSPSSRATLGGMISTDACGKGSRVYGKTSEHVLELRATLIGGDELVTRPLGPAELMAECARTDRVGAIYRSVVDVLERSEAKIRADLPRLRRFLTGYDLAHVRDDQGLFDLGRVLSGSEGTLALVTQAKVRLTPLPKARQVVAIRYARFDDALRAAQVLVAKDPSAIETVDDTIVGLAREDVIWHTVGHLVTSAHEPPAAAINLVEFEAPTLPEVEAKIRELTQILDLECGTIGKATGYTIAIEANDRAALWNLRKKGVGLLGNAKGERRPVPFVEDTVVPPEHLADYIREFRALLDRHGLRYGMFGHVDVGCLHVRPALNMRDPEDEVRLAQISDGVVALVKKYGGVLWGEHGRGYRSQYTPTFFGPEIYEEMRRVKGAFDQNNQLNPGKLATPPGRADKLVQVRSTTRGAFDRQIDANVRQDFEVAIHCNGNGACFDWNPDSVMCPSSKVTSDRIHSPKGRAGIFREWLRLTSRHGYEVKSGQPGLAFDAKLIREQAPDDFSHQVYDAMNGCLACKACATDCPVKVDIPSLRAEFLDHYHKRYRRPLKDYLTAALETLLRVLVLWPRLSNFFTGSRLGKWFFAQVGLVDTPPLASATLSQGLRARGARRFDKKALEQLSHAERERTVLLVQDAFTTFYEPKVALATYDLLTALGFHTVFLPYRENGKALHVKGFLSGFRRIASRSARLLAEAQSLGFALVGIEPAVTLTYRDEYRHLHLEGYGEVQVEMLQEFLARTRETWEPLLRSDQRAPTNPIRLFGHCTERTLAPASQKAWRQVFEAFGLNIETPNVGCCGMCGVFGHEAEHLEESKGVFAMSWAKKIPTNLDARALVLAPGHSCRSQVKRFEGFVPLHPAELLVERLRT